MILDDNKDSAVRYYALTVEPKFHATCILYNRILIFFFIAPQL